jgi:hypothetical protein
LLLPAQWKCTIPSDQPFENHGSHLQHATINTPWWVAKWQVMATKLIILVSEDSCTVACSYQKLCYLPFVFLEVSSGTLAYAFICLSLFHAFLLLSDIVWMESLPVHDLLKLKSAWYSWTTSCNSLIFQALI